VESPSFAASEHELLLLRFRSSRVVCWVLLGLELILQMSGLRKQPLLLVAKVLTSLVADARLVNRNWIRFSMIEDELAQVA
jgi:hypothetical protein